MLALVKNTQLELINDNRSGDKLEMVFMTFN
jgi:hypothetical protein